MSVFSKIKELLEGKEYQIMEHEAVYTSEQAAQVRGTDLQQGAKALVLKTKDGFVMAVISGSKRMDMKKLKKIVGSKKLELAKPEQVKELTDCDIGSVPPFGNLFNLDVYVENSLLENDIIAFNAGSHTKSIKMKAADYEDIVKPMVDEFNG